MQVNVPVYSGVQKFDTANTAGAGVIRNLDNSIDVGQANVDGMENAGPSIQPPGSITSTGALGNGSSKYETIAQTSAAITLTLPPASSSEGQEFVVIKSDATTFAPLVVQSGSDPILDTSGVSHTAGYAMSNTRGKQLALLCDGVNWWANP